MIPNARQRNALVALLCLGFLTVPTGVAHAQRPCEDGQIRSTLTSGRWPPAPGASAPDLGPCLGSSNDGQSRVLRSARALFVLRDRGEGRRAE